MRTEFTPDEILQMQASPALFASIIDPDFRIVPHVRFIDDLLIDAALSGGKRYIINAPPRHGKSVLCVLYFLTWYMCSFPDRRVAIASYQGQFSEEWGGKVRDLVAEYGRFFPGAPRPSRDTSSKARWTIHGRKGACYAVGVGGPLTGRGADILVIDDVLKSQDDALSPTMRQRAWDWLASTSGTRIEPNGSIVFIGTRWHDDDPFGRLIADHLEDWEHFNFRAIAEDDDILGRAPGEALFPSRFPVAALQKIRRLQGESWFQAMFQGEPTPESGEKFRKEWFRYGRIEDDHYNLGGKLYRASRCRHFITVDVASSTGAKADYTVVGVFAQTPDRQLFVVDWLRKRIETPDQPREIVKRYHSWGVRRVIVEKANAGIALFQSLKKDSYPVRPAPMEGGKEFRADAIITAMERGVVWFLEGAPWLADLEKELLGFPRSTYDDQVDVMAYGGIELEGTTGAGRIIVPGKPTVETLGQRLAPTVLVPAAPGRRGSPIL